VLVREGDQLMVMATDTSRMQIILTEAPKATRTRI